MFIFYPLVGAVIAYLIAQKKDNENVWLWTFLGFCIGCVVNGIMIFFLAKSLTNINQAQADKIASDIQYKEQALEAAKTNYSSTDSLTLPQEIDELKTLLANASYSYSNGKAIKK